MIKQVWGSKLNWNRFDVEKNKIPKKQRERNLYYIAPRSTMIPFLGV